MFQKFYRHCQKETYFSTKKAVLLAISGGVDSMVLLKLMEEFAQKENLQLGVAHVNHNLRAEAQEEARFLADYCANQQLPFYETTWQDPHRFVNTEAQAREFRYHFFAQIMQTEGYQQLVTAHHQDDQAETILLKLTRGSQLQQLAGIKPRQPFGTGELVRPFLLFSKEMLQTFAETEKIVYFEDSSNASLAYTRNRLRHLVVPQLKNENPHFLDNLRVFQEQVALASELIEQLVAPKLASWLTPIHHGWSLTLEELHTESPSFQHFFVQALLRDTLIKQGVQLAHTHLEQLVALIDSPKPQAKLTLPDGWQAVRQYQTLYLVSAEAAIFAEPNPDATFTLPVGEIVQVSATEYLLLETVAQPVRRPKAIRNWSCLEQNFTTELAVPLTIRRRQTGDRIALTPQLTKRLKRLFIDQKVPNHIRAQAWVVTDAEQNLIWVPFFVNSYLSIATETDKIQYRLLYLYQEANH